MAVFDMAGWHAWLTDWLAWLAASLAWLPGQAVADWLRVWLGRLV